MRIGREEKTRNKLTKIGPCVSFSIQHEAAQKIHIFDWRWKLPLKQPRMDME